MTEDVRPNLKQQKENSHLIDLSLIIMLLRMSGMLGLESKVWWKSFLHHVYSATCLVFMALAVVANTCGIVRDWGDFDAVVNNACPTMCMLFITVRGIYFNCRRGRMMQLMQRLMEFEVYVQPQEVADDHAKIMTGALRRVHVLTVFFYSFVSVIWLAWVVYPVFADSSNLQQERPHPLIAAYFFDHRRSPIYELVYLLQSASLLLFVPSVCGFDTTAVALLLHISAQFRVLLASLRSVRWLDPGEMDLQLDCSGINKESQPTSDGKMDSAMSRAHWTLMRCIQHHNDLIRYVKEYDAMYHHIMLCQFLYSAFIIALCGFQIIESSDFGVVMKFLLLGYSLLFEMFLFCKCGDDIMHLSLQVGDAAFASGWLHGDAASKFSIWMMIGRARRSCHITAYHVRVLCLHTFGALMNTSYTYLALLRQFKMKI